MTHFHESFTYNNTLVHEIFAQPHFFHFCARLIFAQRQKKFFKNRAILFSRILVARITLIRADYTCAKIKLTRKFHELRYIKEIGYIYI